MKWRCLELRMVYARADLKSFGDIWTYCHLSICQQLWSVGKEHTRGVPLNGNAEVLLGPFAQRCQRGRWRSYPGERQTEKPYRLLKRLQALLPARARKSRAE